jgi:cytochrome c oxidase subunit 1
MYLVTILFFFLMGGVFGLLVRLELLKPNNWLVSTQTYNEIFTLHGVIMIFLFIIPVIPSAIGNFIIPLLIGARDVAFPRLNIISYWIFVLGVAVVMVSFVNPIDTGWTFAHIRQDRYRRNRLAGGIFLSGCQRS